MCRVVLVSVRFSGKCSKRKITSVHFLLFVYIYYIVHMWKSWITKRLLHKLIEKWAKGKILDRWEGPEQNHQTIIGFINSSRDHILVLQHLSLGSHITNTFALGQLGFSFDCNWFSFSSNTNPSELWKRICFLFWFKPKIRRKKRQLFVQPHCSTVHSLIHYSEIRLFNTWMF